MLVLTRAQGETLIIGNDIRIAILRIEGDQVRVGISAPEDVQILRAELIDRYRNAGAPKPHNNE